MTSIFAFVGHSFEDIDKSVVDEFLDYFRSLQEGALPDFKWENAKRADIKTLAKKVLEKMEDKNTFIGICTRKEIAAQESELLKIPLFNKCVFEQSSLQSKTSDWIIQEIGLAIGKELNVVILLEEGVRKPGGLQGDAEYVPFNRNNISKCFPKLLEALCAISPPARVMGSVDAGVQKPDDEEIYDTQDVSNGGESEQEDWTHKQFELAVFLAIAHDNTDEERRLTQEYFESKNSPNDQEKAEFFSRSECIRSNFNKAADITAVREKLEQFPNSYAIKRSLARILENHEEFSDAYDMYISATENVRNDSKLMETLVSAAKTKLMAGEEYVDQWLIKEVNNLDGILSTDAKKIFYKGLISLSDEADDVQFERLAYGEKLLELYPEDYDERFQLAFSYSKLDRRELSLGHYLVIPDDKAGEYTFNNIGVCLSELQIYGKSIDYFNKAKDKANTLAMSNLANKLIQIGFHEQARHLCDEARTHENYHENIDSSLTSLSSTKNSENEKFDNSKIEFRKQKPIFLDYADARLSAFDGSLAGVWSDILCDELTITTSGNEITMSGHYVRNPLGTLTPFGSSKPTKCFVEYKGIICGRGIAYTKITKDLENTRRSLLSIEDNHWKENGIMIISEDCNSIRVFKDAKDDELKSYQITRMNH